jgi:hypothetical protein
VKIIAKTKLSELPITWKEAYTDKTKRLKDMYEDIVGSGSYFRFEGTNSETGDEYYVVCGPAKVKSPKPEFFAGLRKLPSDFAASGKYFSEIREAIEYASETWGVEIPSSISYYDSDDLKNIGDKVKEWRDSHEWESPDKEDEDEDVVEDKAASTSYVFRRFAMGAPARVGRQGYNWYDIDAAALNIDEQFKMDSQQWPALAKAAQKAYAQREKFRQRIVETYGSEHLKSEFYHIWLSFSPEYGAYIVSVGPYFEYNKETQEYTPSDRFDAFWKRLNVFSQEFLDKKVSDLLAGYSEKYGVQLTPQDYVPPAQGELSPQFKLTPEGRAKVYDAVCKAYGVDPKSLDGEGLKRVLTEKFKEAHPKWKAELDAAYQKSKENGDAFMKSQPPPPDIRWMKPRPIGQQMNSSAHQTGEEEGSAKGFETLKEAIDYVNTKSWAGCPMLEGYKDVTSADLAEARIKHEAEMASQPQQPEPAPAKVKPNQNVVPSPAVAEEDIDIPESFMEQLESHQGTTTAATISRLISLAENLDNSGNGREAEEIHKILRRHVGVKKISSDISSKVEYKFRNFYECPDCKVKWQDEWDSMCNDRCPKCDKEIQPYASEDI